MFPKATSYKYVVEHIKSLEPPLPEKLDVIEFMVSLKGKHYYYLSSTTNPKYGGYGGMVEVLENGTVNLIDNHYFESYILRLANQHRKK